MTDRQALGSKVRWYAKSFAALSGLYAGVECVTAKSTAEENVVNHAVAGCITGAALQVKAGPQAACLGCAGFAAFSVVIDQVMKSM